MNKSFRESRIERHQCPSCEASIVNGVYCHETGCPDNHLFITRDCKWCGCAFTPENRNSLFCSDDCLDNYSC